MWLAVGMVLGLVAQEGVRGVKSGILILIATFAHLWVIVAEEKRSTFKPNQPVEWLR